MFSVYDFAVILIFKGIFAVLFCELFSKFAKEQFLLRTMTKYIIGAISDLDIPMNPSAKGSRSSSAYLTNQTYEEIQKERDELLACTQDDIRALADYMDAIMKAEAVCVVGNGQAIEENKEMFGTIENLFH